jgi:hypothetical protein
MSRFGEHLSDVKRCPYCGVANPVLHMLLQTGQPVPRATPGSVHKWALYACSSCGGALLAKGAPNDNIANPMIVEVIPAPKEAHVDIPEPARRYLQQAYETLHAPDAAAVMAGSAVDAMLKQKGYADGSLYNRIDTAVENHVLTSDMGDWAHEVRLGSNRPRHSDSARPHVTADEAKQSVEFAEALGYFLFVLSSRIERGKEAAKKASSVASPS